ncbi:bactofilin family protein [Caulobacter sp. RL271]|jgi:cytoskeletal protein CcmA (bactofilin family)|uniref:Polymer-forming cytoskeletal protein n=1 Tax=Caulobacter segnis TaxID=88688 RepID=A0ABY4ZM77_9CAUL|nr:polymer-forming cytoskeletal protein [Caulobacter segnis]USQ93709.1 polymer-forming cytoskeletal protein [Caulobacter segnis]
MFSKQAKSAPKTTARIESLPTPAAAGPADQARRATPKVASLLSADLTIQGDISGEGELQVDGMIKGDIRVGRLTIGETGHIEGSIYAEIVEVRGRVVGTITAKQVRLYGASYIDGDITHEQLAIESGAFFQGRSLKFQRPAPVVQPAPQPEPQLAIAEAVAG